jgi:hypothetical protein
MRAMDWPCPSDDLRAYAAMLGASLMLVTIAPGGSMVVNLLKRLGHTFACLYPCGLPLSLCNGIGI